MVPPDNELVAKLAERTSLSAEVLTALLDDLGELVFEYAGEGIDVPGLGHFVFEQGAAYEVVNPGTGESVSAQGPPRLAFYSSNEIWRGSPDQTESEPREPRLLPQIRLSLDEKDASKADLDSSQLEKSATKLGGEPDWLHSSEHPNCCGSQMTFFGQLDSSIGGDFNLVDAGMLFVFVCDHCGHSQSRLQFH